MREPNHPDKRLHPRARDHSPVIIEAEGGVEKPRVSQGRPRKPSADSIADLTAVLSQKGRPVGVFLLLGPTGTGKTKTVEALADVLHGSEKNVLKVDCGEFQMEHEVAKLIGAPPGYLGHRETQPMLTQQKLNAVTSEKCSLSLVLFDEIEKAAPSMTRLLMGVLDKGVLRLGDNTTVNFEKSLVFLTSNLGAQRMSEELDGGFGFAGAVPCDEGARERRIGRIGMHAVRKRFTPEFVNRIDCIITYQPLTPEA